ncbi:hypothetical protein Tco_1099456 [Tanacetum coccineum]
MMGTCSESGGLYLLDEPSNQTLGKNNNVSPYVSKTLWHNKLGHPADQVFDVLQKELQDVYFYENVFPFKMNSKLSNEKVVISSDKDLLSQLNFFDNLDNQTSKSPYDEARATPNDDSNAPNSLNNHVTVRDESGNATSMVDKSISEDNSQHTQSVLVFSNKNC